MWWNVWFYGRYNIYNFFINIFEYIIKIVIFYVLLENV